MSPSPAAAITDSANFRPFILGGNALFTIVSRKTGNRRTFKVRELPAKPGRTDSLFGVSFLNGPENTTDYKYLGTLFPKRDGSLGFKLKEGNLPTSESAVAFGWLVSALNGQADLSRAELWHAGRCSRCGRTLTDPESIATGIGPKCAGRN